jgi:hypothetical protein
MDAGIIDVGCDQRLVHQQKPDEVLGGVVALSPMRLPFDLSGARRQFVVEQEIH